MFSPWKSMTLDQYTHHSKELQKAENQVVDAQNKIARGDNTPETQERLSIAKSKYDAYAPVVQTLRQELT